MPSVSPIGTFCVPSGTTAPAHHTKHTHRQVRKRGAANEGHTEPRTYAREVPLVIADLEPHREVPNNGLKTGSTHPLHSVNTDSSQPWVAWYTF